MNYSKAFQIIYDLPCFNSLFEFVPAKNKQNDQFFLQMRTVRMCQATTAGTVQIYIDKHKKYKCQTKLKNVQTQQKTV